MLSFAARLDIGGIGEGYLRGCIENVMCGEFAESSVRSHSIRTVLSVRITLTGLSIV